MKWKNNLLASGLPLEYEAALIADNLGFEIVMDYTYNRINESGMPVDFSIDLFLTKSIQKNELKLLLCVPVECKYRSPDAIWLFLPDFTPEEQFFAGHVIITEFAEHHQLSYGNTYLFTRYTDRTCKGIEIKGESVYDKEIKHGLQQLRYSLPKACIDVLWGQRLEHSINDRVFLIAPTLLTTATLRLATHTFSLQSLQNSYNIDKISTQSSQLLYTPGKSVDYEKHCYNSFQQYKDCKIPRYYYSYEYVKVGDIQETLMEFISDPTLNICSFDSFSSFLGSLIEDCFDDLESKF